MSDYDPVLDAWDWRSVIYDHAVDDPLIELYEYKRKMSERYTMDELWEYIKQVPTPDEALTQVRAKLAAERKNKLATA